MGDIFKAAIAEPVPHKKKELLLSLEVIENKNDKVTHEIFIQLGLNFITPLDREDIYHLGTSLHKISHYLWGAAKRIVNYNVEDTKTLSAFSEIICASVAEVNTAVYGLRNMKDLQHITTACVRINDLENDADNLFDAAMLELFASSVGGKEIIKRKDIFRMLERLTDKCEDASNAIETIIIKYT